MSLWFPIISSDFSQVAENDIFRFTFNVNNNEAFNLLPDLSKTDLYIPLVSDYLLHVDNIEKDLVKKKIYITGGAVKNFQTSSGRTLSSVRSPNVVPVVAIAIGILVLLGLSLAYLTFDKVEKLVSNPAINLIIVAGIIFALYYFVVHVIKKN
jgi:hypothetical protein